MSLIRKEEGWYVQEGGKIRKNGKKGRRDGGWKVEKEGRMYMEGGKDVLYMEVSE